MLSIAPRIDETESLPSIALAVTLICPEYCKEPPTNDVSRESEKLQRGSKLLWPGGGDKVIACISPMAVADVVII
jgi:hypothetical protein